VTFREAHKLTRDWGDKPCLHPERIAETTRSGEKTGDYYCALCGAFMLGASPHPEARPKDVEGREGLTVARSSHRVGSPLSRKR
jgi:hypothetical protein